MKLYIEDNWLLILVGIVAIILCGYYLYYYIYGVEDKTVDVTKEVTDKLKEALAEGTSGTMVLAQPIPAPQVIAAPPPPKVIAAPPSVIAAPPPTFTPLPPEPKKYGPFHNVEPSKWGPIKQGSARDPTQAVMKNLYMGIAAEENRKQEELAKEAAKRSKIGFDLVGKNRYS